MSLPYDKIADLDQRRLERVADIHGFVAEILTVANVPSFSPAAAEWMLDTLLPALDKTLEQPELPEDARRILLDYRKSISTILHVAVYHQRAVIDQLHRMLRTVHARDVGVADPDHLETYEALIKLANLGKKEKP